MTGDPPARPSGGWPGRPRARVVLLAGASGSGKTRLSRRAGVPTVALDDFYRDHDDPEILARYPIAVDWDDAFTWDAVAAADALEALCREGVAEVPDYDISASRRRGSRRVELGGSRVVVAEGIFAAELVGVLTGRLLLAEALYLHRHRASTFVRRLARDLVEGRKAPWTLVRRGTRLARQEPELRRRWRGLGCTRASRSQVERTLAALAAATDVPRARLDPRVDHLAALQDASAAIADRLASRDLDVPVPSCPGWTVADVAMHLGETHRWARTAVAEGHGRGDGSARPVASRLAEWFSGGAHDLVKALSAADAADSAWTFTGPPAVAFWIRRQTHETVMHAWDVCAAYGESYPVAANLAADGVDEVVRVMWPRQVAKGRALPPSRALALEGTGSARRWVLGNPSDPDPDVGATVSAPDVALLLLLWGRIDADDPRLTVRGDESVVGDVLDRALTP